MTEKRIILVPVDFSDISDRALRQAHTLSKVLGKKIVLLYVIEDKGGWFNLFSGEQKKMAREQIEQKLNALKARAIKFSNNDVTWEIEEGKPYVKILEKAQEIDPAFIVMGVRGELTHESEKNYVGTNTSKIIRAANCPVITVSSRITCHNLRSILLPLDLTRETRQKVTNAIELAKKFNARIKVMSALWSLGDGVVAKELQTIINQVVNFIKEAGIECEGELVQGSSETRTAVPIILKYAEEQGDIDMILIMTQSEMRVLEYFISSNAQEMLKLSPFPLMSIQPKQLERTIIGY